MDKQKLINDYLVIRFFVTLLFLIISIAFLARSTLEALLVEGFISKYGLISFASGLTTLHLIMDVELIDKYY